MLMAEKKSAKTRTQINVLAPANVYHVYQSASEIGGLNAGRIVLAGMLWLIEHPEHRQPAMDRLQAWATDRSLPRTREQVDAWIRKLSSEHFGDALVDQVKGARGRKSPRNGRRRPAGGNNSVA